LTYLNLSKTLIIKEITLLSKLKNNKQITEITLVMNESVFFRVVSLFLFLLYLQDTSAQEQKVKLGISYASSMYSNKEQFEFSNGEETIVLNSQHPVVYFSKEYRAGQAYSIQQVSGPRTVDFQGAAAGTIGNQDKIILANCGHPPLTIFKLKIIGVEQGETFKFIDNYRRTYNIPFSTTTNLGGYPRGDDYLISQTEGPRQCRLSFNQGIVEENSITVLADCRKVTSTNPPAPQYRFDLVTRSSDSKIFNTYYESSSPVIGGKGEDEARYVAFVMYGKNIDGSNGNYRQIFWRDRKAGITKLVSKSAAGEQGNQDSSSPSISADGRFVVFETYATNFSGTDNNAVRDVYLWDRTTEKLTLISKSITGTTANGESYEPVISGDGSTIAYTSHASDIVKLEPVFKTPNVYVCDVNGGSTAFITNDFETGKAAGGYAPSISDNGTKIAFCAYTGRLVKNDSNNLWDIFLWQRGTPILKRISMTASGGERNQGTESSSRVVWPSISGNGEFIVFATTATNMENAEDKNNAQDIFIYNTMTDNVKRVTKTNESSEPNGDSPISQGERIGISYDGTWIAYNTNATNLGVPKGNIVIQSTRDGRIVPITRSTYGSTARPMLSRYGNYVVAGCSEKYDQRFSSSGIFVIYTDKGPCNNCYE